MTTPTPESEARPPRPPSPPLWADRVGTKTYVGTNDRGAQVRIGPHTDDGVFSPGELLKIALAACSGMSAERGIDRRLGADTPIKVGVRSVAGTGENRYARLLTELVIPMGELSDRDRDLLVTVATRAVDVGCTVGRTIEASAEIELTVTDGA